MSNIQIALTLIQAQDLNCFKCKEKNYKCYLFENVTVKN